MEFRWVAFITLWTLFSGPVLAQPQAPAARKTSNTAQVEVSPSPTLSPTR